MNYSLYIFVDTCGIFPNLFNNTIKEEKKREEKEEETLHEETWREKEKKVE